jgi:ribosome-associated translation inhibitor RaiA
LKKFKNVELLKFPILDEVDVAILEKNLVRFLEKISFGDNDKLVLTCKEYSKGGLRKQHEIKANLLFFNKNILASETNWQFLETVQDVFKKLEKEVLKSTSK